LGVKPPPTPPVAPQYCGAGRGNILPQGRNYQLYELYKLYELDEPRPVGLRGWSRLDEL